MIVLSDNYFTLIKSNMLKRLKLKVAAIFRVTLTLISPKLSTKVLYRIKFGKKLDLNNPVTLNEKILWLKFNTYWNNPLIKQCSDKYQVREYIKRIGCGEILNDLSSANLIGSVNGF